jgi:hypothetical protein
MKMKSENYRGANSMNLDDFVNYWEPACENLFGERPDTSIEENIKYYRKLDSALGTETYKRFWNRSMQKDFPMEENLKNLLVKLAGPHGKALLRAYQIQHGVKNHDQ